MNSTENQQNKQQQNKQERELSKTNSNNQEILLEIAQQKLSKNNETIQNQPAKKAKPTKANPKTMDKQT